MRRGAGVDNPYRYIGAEARALGDGWESVGDMASLDADGYLYLADRKRDMILVGGSHVSPAEVENPRTAPPPVHSGGVIRRPRGDRSQVPPRRAALAGTATSTRAPFSRSIRSS